MTTKKNYAILGLGKYGFAVAKELVKSGAQVLAVDKNMDIINNAITEIPLCKCADVTDAEVLRQLDIANFDVVVIAMADSLESAVMATALCKEMGVKTVVAKCSDKMQQKILSKIGADKVVFPEEDSGIRLARNLLSSGFADLFELSEDVSVIELELKPDWQGKNLLELNLRKKYSLNVVALNKNGNIYVDIDPEEALSPDTKLIVIATSKALKKLK